MLLVQLLSRCQHWSWGRLAVYPVERGWLLLGCRVLIDVELRCLIEPDIEVVGYVVGRHVQRGTSVAQLGLTLVELPAHPVVVVETNCRVLMEALRQSSIPSALLMLV